MRLLFLFILIVFLNCASHSQEFIPSLLLFEDTPVSSCSSCDGECVVYAEASGVLTYRWDDADGGLLAVETSDLGYSSVSDLCLGAYKVTVSSGTEVFDEAFFSISEEEVNMGLPGVIYSCTNFESISLDDLIPTEAELDGVWLNQVGFQVEELVTSENTSGLYYYTVENDGCVNYSQIPLVVNAPAYIGEFPNVQICEDFDSFNFWVYADSDNYPDPNGVFLNENFEEVDPYFNPNDSLPGEYDYIYLIDTVPGCIAPMDPFFIRVNSFNNAGDDAVAYVCSMEDEVLDLNSYLSSNANENGMWYDSDNQIVENLLDESIVEQGLYRYTVSSNVPCMPDVSYVDIVFVDALDAGQDIEAQFCSDTEVVMLPELLESEISPNGYWYDQESNLISEEYYLEDFGIVEFTYELTGVGCASSIVQVNIEVDELLSAGEDVNTVQCETGELLDLNTLLSPDASLNSGVWLNSIGEEVDPIFILEPSINEFTYFIEQSICPDQNALFEVVIEDGPAFPELGPVYFCVNQNAVSLTEELGVNSEWVFAWENSLGEGSDEWFTPSVAGAFGIELTIDSENSCDVYSNTLQVIVEDNQFESQTIAAQICNTGLTIDLEDFIEESIASSNFEWMTNEGLILSDSEVSMDVIQTSFQLVETSLSACEANVVTLEIELVPFFDAGPSTSIIQCSSNDVLDLSSFEIVVGNWFLNDSPLTTSEVVLSYENQGIYQFIAENHEICPISDMELDLTVEDAFDYSPIADVGLCSGEELTVWSPYIENGAATTWVYEDVNFTSDQLFLLLETAGELEVLYEITEGTCVEQDNFVISIYPDFELNIIGETELCVGEILQLEVESGYNINWSLNGQFLTDDELIHTLTPISNSIYSAEGESEFGCAGTDSVVVQVNQVPEAEIVVNQYSGCAPFQLELSALSDDESDVTYQWSLGGVLQNGPFLSLEIGEGDYFDVQLNILGTNGCSSTISLPQPIEGFESPIAKFEFENNSLSYLNPTAQIQNESTNFDFISWTLDGEEIDGGTNSWGYTFSEEPNTGYELCVEVVSTEGCVDYYCEYITINSELLLYIPNAFTPDGDGINELFYPQFSGNSLDLFQFQIFDRWGSDMFFSTDVNSAWNGNIQGGEHYAPPGVYTYVISIKDQFTAEIQTVRGHVTLLR